MEVQICYRKGIAGEIDGRAATIGNAALLEELRVDPRPLAARTETMRELGQTVMFDIIDEEPGRLIAVADTIKEGADEALRGLRDEGLKVIMVTGDNETTARAVAGKLRIRSSRRSH